VRVERSPFVVVLLDGEPEILGVRVGFPDDVVRICSAIQLWSALTGRNLTNLFKSNKSSELVTKKRIIFRAVRLDFVQRRPERPTRYQPRATPWVNNGEDCALQGQKPYRCHNAFALAGRLLAHSLPQGVALG
jgi:hypothetical protein